MPPPGGAFRSTTARHDRSDAATYTAERNFFMMTDATFCPAPAKTDRLDAANPPMPTRRPESTRERILIVEDDGAARVGLQQLIRSWGFEVETAADGEQALEKFGAFHPGIVLTDLVMPKMGGLDLLRKLEEQGEPVTTV